MKNKNQLTAVLTATILFLVALGCSGDETAKANALVDEANKFVAEGNKLVEETRTKGDEFDRRVREIDSNDEHKRVSEYGSTELVPRYEKMRENFQNASDKFGAAAKLKLTDKFKEYLDLKSSEFKKRAEFAEALKAIPKTLADSKDESAYQSAVKKDVEKVQALSKEAQEFGDKAAKIQTENPQLFKSN